MLSEHKKISYTYCITPDTETLEFSCQNSAKKNITSNFDLNYISICQKNHIYLAARC